MLLTILTFVAVFSVLVLIHEAGHFMMAKLFGVKVLEFAVGFPPRLGSVIHRGTRYSLNLLPLGGFVKLLGEENPSEPGSLARKSKKVRATVLLAGPFMNLVLAMVLLSLVAALPQPSLVGQVAVLNVSAGSPAQEAGLRPGDLILAVDNQPVHSLSELQIAIREKLGQTVTLYVNRRIAGTTYTDMRITLVPRSSPPAGQGPLGVSIQLANPRVVTHREPLWKAVPTGVTQTFTFLFMLPREIGNLATSPSDADVTGPIGIAQLTGEVARIGFIPLLSLTALLSLNLAILNVLPFPALDGGRILFVAIEALRGGKRISPQREGLVHLIGFAVLIAIVVIISYHDVLRIVRGGSILP